MSRRGVFTVLLAAAVLALAGCGSSKTTTSSAGGSTGPSATHVRFAKTKFALHAGLAFGTFHHFIYAPFKAGDFSHPFSHKLTVLKALAAGLFVKHEVSLALTDARASKLLSHVVAPITALGAGLAAIRGSIAGHHPNAHAITSANTDVAAAEFNSSSAGQPIKEMVGSP
ncbi:MAG TPA: hypothetical protein VG388_12190 [Solirubrobacteraceae bacterium]|nr:hypothetical protein [Solirubrobacteraceae bacterium]